MKALLCAIIAICFLQASTPWLLSAAFTNLNFESATVAAPPANYTPTSIIDPISAAAGLPGWTAYVDTTQCTAIWGQAQALDETAVGLVYNSSSYPETPIRGKYSVELYSTVFDGINGQPGYYSKASISQTGLVPSGTHFIEFEVESPPKAAGTPTPIPATPTVTLNGTALTLQTISTSNGIITMAADVSAFAGSTANLTFSALAATPPPNGTAEDLFWLDDIQFTPTLVPEPGTWLMAGLLAAMAGWRLQRKGRFST